MLNAAILPFANADQPYAGGYAFNGSTIWHLDKAGFTTHFNQKTGDLPQKDILSVLSMSGSTDQTGTNGVNGYFYQLVNQWETTGTIYGGIDQVWGPNTARTAVELKWPIPFDFAPNSDLCTISNVVRVTTSAAWSSDDSQVKFLHRCIKDDGTSKSVSVTYSKVSGDTSKYFLFGKCTGTACNPDQPSSRTIKFFQFGIEGEEVTDHFKIKQGNMWLWDTFDFSPKRILRPANYAANLVWSDSYIGWYTHATEGAGFPVYIGGFTYPDVLPHSKVTDNTLPAGTVEWEGDGDCTVPALNKCYNENDVLWNSNSGGVFTVGTTPSQISPATGDSYEGERRVVLSHDGTTVFAFYYDTNNNGIVQKTSTTGGETWGSLTPLNTGTLVSDYYRWSVVYTMYQGTQYIYVFYWVQGNPDTENHHFKFSRGIVAADGKSISSWSSPVELGYTLGHSDCGTGGACAAV